VLVSEQAGPRGYASEKGGGSGMGCDRFVFSATSWMVADELCYDGCSVSGEEGDRELCQAVE
jgi:hypothetical protein